MTRLNELPETLAERFAVIDYRSHLALLAEVFEGGRETMIGEARYVVDARDPETCEFAIAVADDWQASGIARALLDRLERQAAASGIRRMVADTLLANTAMIGLATRSGTPSGEPGGCRAGETGKSSASGSAGLPSSRWPPEHITAVHEQPKPNGERR